MASGYRQIRNHNEYFNRMTMVGDIEKKKKKNKEREWKENWRQSEMEEKENDKLPSSAGIAVEKCKFFNITFDSLPCFLRY